ncbi:MAG: signal peptidase I [Phenylobacterium sp.]
MTETTVPPEGERNETIEILKTVAVALLIALFLRFLLFQPFTIPSASEEPNLYEGDYVIVTKFDYGWSRHSIPFSPSFFEGRLLSRAPERGDIIVFKLPRDGRTDYIKRLVGMPGDRVQMRVGLLYLNGEPVTRRQVEIVNETGGSGMVRPVARVEETLPGGRRYMTNDFGTGGDLDDTPEVIVPAGHYFFMGDNRDNSADSRLPPEIGVGLVPEANLVGKARLVLLSWSPGASIFKPWTWVLNLRPSRFGKVLH